jgi:hypothetical protein
MCVRSNNRGEQSREERSGMWEEGGGRRRKETERQREMK